MDESVVAAIARWPNVPHLYDWLSLDRRGKWRLKGSPISNQHVVDFIGRNYESDARGAWFFQNGPQRGYMQLEYTPWILRTMDVGTMVTHTGLPVQPIEALLDENGNLLVVFERGVGLVEDRELPALLEAIVDANGLNADEASLARLMAGEPQDLWLDWNETRIPLSPVQSHEVPQRFGFLQDPQPET